MTEVARRHDVHPICFICGVGRRALELCHRLPITGDALAGCDYNGQRRGGHGGRCGLRPLIEVVLRNGRVLRLPAGVSPARAGALADLLERS